MMKETKTTKELKIIDYGYDGEGVGKIGGKVCFVPYTLIDEVVEFSPLQEKKSFCKGKLVGIYDKSDKRIDAPCPYFTKCGGCSYQHTNYNNELQIKKLLLSRQLAKIEYSGDIELVPSEKEYGYRNKLKLYVDESSIGLYYKGSNKICPIQDCLLVDNLISKAILPIKNFVEGNKLYRFIQNIVLRQENESCLINFILKSYKDINYQGLYLLLGKNYGIFQTYDNEEQHIVGLKSLSCEEFGLKCNFSPSSFHQVNKYLGNKLYEIVLNEIKGKNILNCYSGAGVLSGMIANIGNNVTAIELGKHEHDDAEKLKQENDLISLTNICGDCQKVIPSLKNNFDTIIVDPPRSGMAIDVCNEISKKNFKRLIYISCDSATLVRDLQRLTNVKIKKVYLVDMFARTGEYETVVILNKG